MHTIRQSNAVPAGGFEYANNHLTNASHATLTLPDGIQAGSERPYFRQKFSLPF